MNAWALAGPSPHNLRGRPAGNVENYDVPGSHKIKSAWDSLYLYFQKTEFGFEIFFTFFLDFLKVSENLCFDTFLTLFWTMLTFHSLAASAHYVWFWLDFI